MMISRWLLAGAAWWAAAAVALGAFGAHALVDRLPEIHPPDAVGRMAANWETAARYHLIHALAALVAALVATGRPALGPSRDPAAPLAGASVDPPWWAWLPAIGFLLGTLIFSGCLYALVLGGPKVLGAVVPVGGALLILAWIGLGCSFLVGRHGQ